MITSNSITMNIWRGLFLDRIQHSFALDRITKKKFWRCKSSRGWSKENKQVWKGTQKNKDRKDYFGPNLGHKFFCEGSILLDVDIVPSCDLVQYQGKLMMQPWENAKSPNFRPNLGPPIFFFMGFTSTSS